MTVVEVTRTSIRVLQAEGRGRGLRVRNLLVEPLIPGGDPGAQFERMMRQAGADRGSVVATISREQIITRLLKFPTTKPDELASMVELTGKAQLPFPPNQAVADFQVIDQQGGTSTVQLVACHRELVDQQIALIQRGGAEPAAVVPSSWGLLGWYERIGQTAQTNEPALVVNVDTDHTDLVLIRQAKLLYSRSLGQGVAEWQAGEAGLAAAAQEIERSVSSLRKELPGADVATVVLTGLGMSDHWKAALGQRLGRPVVLRPAAGQPPILTVTPEPGVSTAITLGLALMDTRALPNLLPHRARQAQAQRRRLRELVVTVALLALVALAGVGLLVLRVQRQRRLADDLAATQQQLERATAQTDSQQRHVALVESMLAGRRQLAEVLVELFQLTPPSVVIESLMVESSKDDLTVRGDAPTTREVLDFIKALENSSRYERVELRYSSRRTTRTGASVEFEFIARLRQRP